jgi:Ca-activated chloride channel family protein
LPLKSTQADVKIAGVVAEVTVTQIYKNQGKKTLEAVYVFPGSTRAAVHALRMTIGERVVEAEIMERQKARATYEDAKRQGKTASLLEQQRPNVFQMNVANILPGDEIKVELKYLELLLAQDQVYEFVYPTVVGPRYSNQAAAGAPDTEKWVENPYLHQGQAPPYTFGLRVDLHTGLPISKLTSPSHDLEIKYSGDRAAAITLKDEKTGGNKDFVLRYALAGDKIDTGLLLYPGKEENFFLMMLEPPGRVAAQAAVPREYIFIVDVSGSMHGYPLDTAKTLMKDIIALLKPQDFINVLLFESGAAVLSETGSLPASQENKEKALTFIQAQPGGGGTEIVPAFKRALALPRTKNTSRIVVVATDGYVHVEPQFFELIRQNLGAANLFPFGIGTSVNRHLIEGMARAGMGEPFVVLNPAEAPKQAERFRRYIANPVLTDIRVDFPGFAAYEVEPAQLPDLFSLRPITLLGKYRGSPTGEIVVTGKTAQRDFRQSVKVTEGQAGPANSGLRLLWARQRIMQLMDAGRLEKGDGPAQEVTGLGLKYSLMTPYTSFVAVDKVKRADGQVITVKQPLPLPEGVSDLAVGGGGPSRLAMKAKVGPGGGGYSSHFLAARESFDASTSGGGGLAPPSPAPLEPSGPAAPKLSLTIQVVQVQGKLDPAGIKQALEDRLPQFTSCCREALARGVKLPVEIILDLAIDAAGRLTGQPCIKTPLGDEVMEKCLAQAVRGLNVTNPGNQAAVVTVKLVF